MSVYIVQKKHILYLVQAAQARRIAKGSAFRWFHGGACHELFPGANDRAADVGNMLWRENFLSVGTRYRHESSAALPGPIGGEFAVAPEDFSGFALWDGFDPVQVLKACDCFAYQSCEHDAWHDSEALSFINSLRESAWRALPGYDAAAWGVPETLRARGRKIIELSKLNT